jgi:16S rRNA (cytosine967-C5)-methyltransferase
MTKLAHDSRTATSFADVPWPVHDPVKCLSLQYSMPEFLVRAWITEYAVNETRQICRAANQPGPILSGVMRTSVRRTI